MTKMTRDIPNHEGMTVADRLKVARQDANVTRKAVADGTGIPSSTVEKYERGDMDPNTARLKTLCDFYGVSFDWVLNGDGAPSIATTPKPSETMASACISETFAKTFAESAPQQSETVSSANENDPMEHVRGLLDDMDDMRAHGFDGMQRQAIALADEVRVALKYLEPGELLAMAYERGLYKGESCLDVSGILNLFAEDLDEGQAYCGIIEERILDTVILGVDLYGIEREPLVELADELKEDHDIEEPAWAGFSWGQHKDFVPLIRPIVRAMANRGDRVDFTDQDKYPKRKV